MFATKNENPILWLEQYGDYLYGYALARLRDEAAAEDLLQETLLAALESRRKFAGCSSVKTWLTAILKHKIIDYYRRASRQISFVSESDESDFFDETGCWRKPPADWNLTPECLLQQKEFQTVLAESVMNLPENLRAVFILREFEELETGEICRQLNLSPNNLWVLLHRARLQLRQEIESRWFENTGKIVERSDKLAYSN